MNFIFLLFVTTNAFECISYARTFSEHNTVISKKDREMYLPMLCTTTSLCHASPILSSYEAFANDIIHCYQSRNYNFDTSILETVRPNVTKYIAAKELRWRSAMSYDALNYEAKDAMAAIIDVVRIRDSYLREFQYSKPPILTGDVALLLEHNRRRYDINSEHQNTNIQTITTTSLTQLETAQKWQTQLEEAYLSLMQAMSVLEESKLELDDVFIMIKKNVIESMLRIS